MVTFVTNWLALIPWRKARKEHWTEQARLCFPVRVASNANFWVLPAVVTIFCVLIFPDNTPNWGLLALVAAIGVVAGTIPMEREVFPRVGCHDLLRQMAFGCLIRLLVWFVFLMAGALMPPDFNLQALAISILALVVCAFWNQTGWVLLGRKLGLLVPAPERLRKIAQETSTAMNVPFKQLWLMKISFAQGAALPASGVLLFSERLLELLSDHEIATICAHELGHLSERRHQYFSRYVIWFGLLPWILVRPMIHTFGAMGFFLLGFNTLFTTLLYRSISRRLEVRADSIAKTNEPDEGTYAWALLRLHEDNLIPAVLARNRATHPHLYDRLVAAGFAPDFPRPAAAAPTSWNGWLFSIALGLLMMLLVVRLTGR